MINKLYNLVTKKRKEINSNSETLTELYELYTKLKHKKSKTKLEDSLYRVLKPFVALSHVEQSRLKSHCRDLSSEMDYAKHVAKQEGKRVLNSKVVDLPNLKTNNADVNGHGKRSMLKRFELTQDLDSFVLTELQRIDHLSKTALSENEKKVVRRERSYLNSIISENNLDVSQIKQVI